MKLVEVVEGIALRCGNMDADRCAALASDMRAAGLREGPNLQTAFDRWRAMWTKRAAPTAAEFASFARAPTAPLSGGGNGFHKRQEERDAARRQLAREMAEAGFVDFRQRYGKQEWEWQAWTRIVKLANEYAQAKQLFDAGRMREQRFADYRYKLTDEEITNARQSWESQRDFRSSVNTSALRQPTGAP